MTTTLITGASKGLGRETARQLVAAGHSVYAASRDEQRGQEAAAQIGARPLLLDVTSDESVEAAAAQIRAEAGHLDVLVNNAGVPGGRLPPAETPAANLEAVYAVNVFGVVRVTKAFLPLLETSDAPVIVNVSSSIGSITRAADPDSFESNWTAISYPSSKSALNMITVQYARAFPGMRINTVDPGYTATDLNGHRGTQTVEEGAEIIVRMAQIGPDGPTGTFSNRSGPVAW